MLRALIVAGWLITIAGAALAQAPDFDINAYCRQIAGDSYVIEQSCREMEAKAQQTVESESVDPRIMGYCAQIAGGSYTILMSCIDMESSAKKSLGYGAGEGGHMVIMPTR